MRCLALLVLSAITLAACADESLGPMGPVATSPTYEPPPSSGAAFDPRDFAWSTGQGAGSIVGALTYHRGAERYSCRGGDVLLTPETAWSRRRMVVLYGSAIAAAAPVSIVRARTPSAGAGDYARFVRRTTCDAASRFSFQGLPDGAWFVITVGKAVDGTGEPIAVTRRVETHGGQVSVPLS